MRAGPVSPPDSFENNPAHDKIIQFCASLIFDSLFVTGILIETATAKHTAPITPACFSIMS